MFDPVTSALLRSAPELPGLNSESIPQLLTRHYADLVSTRLRGAEDEPAGASAWPLERIADTYELITSIHADNAVRRASAFVAGTAQQILARRQWESEDAIQRPLIDRDQVSPAIAAALLFLAAEQYADAYEAAAFIPYSGDELPYEVRIISEDIADLARGRLTSIIERAARWRRGDRRIADIQERAFAALLETLITAIELLAAEMLASPPPAPSAGRFENARQAIKQVLDLSSNSADHAELGGEFFTVYAGPRHIAALAERMFRRPDGANVIVATPTLAQGLNLPAELAILAGDKRAAEAGGREDLEAHEILNAAARAGRAGHLANGVVLLVPEPIIGFSRGKVLSAGVVAKLRAVLPENDRCVTISDPLEVVLDRLMEGDTDDRDVRYTINRMALLRDAKDGDEASSIFDLDRSLAAYAARQAAKEAEFDDKLATLKQAINEGITPETDQVVFALASKSGLPAEVLLRLRARVSKDAGSLPISIPDWIKWTFDWLKADSEARQLLLYDIAGAARGASGRKKAGTVEPEVLDDLLAGVLAWISGKTIAEIETILGGNPHSTTDSLRVCPRTRELIGAVIPRGLAFIISIVSYVVTELDLVDQQEELSRELVEGLSTAVRLGYDTPEKLSFATQNANVLGRVQAHRAWAAENQA